MLLLSMFVLNIFIFTCGSDSNPVAPEQEPEQELVSDDAALAQLLNMYQPDFPAFNLITTPDELSIISFQTSVEFKYTGNTSVPISAVRGVVVWYEDIDGNTTDIGTSIGIIVNSGGDNNGLEVNTLEPNQLYFYLSEWNGDPFLFVRDDGSVPVYTNFFALNGSDSISLSKPAGQINRGGGRRLQ